jgi:undecaprenyl diphosphate synthase
MSLLRIYLRNDTARLVQNGIRLSVIGRRDRLPRGLSLAIKRAERATARGNALLLRIALDYSSRDAILSAAARIADREDLTSSSFSRLLGGGIDSPDVDLLIRTSGEQRLSDFLLWESAYAELYFTQSLWPDFQFDDLALAVAELAKRERRFGGLSPITAA